jgi:predicted branched-subunit amino acid permease
MTRATAKSYFWRGCRHSLPFIFIAGPFGLLFGVLATEAGLKLFEVMVFTISVFAGAAQFTALQLMQEEAPTLIVLASALAVNLRVAMYSAALTPYLGQAPLWQRACAAYMTVDQSYALSVMQFERDPEMSLGARLAYFFGTNAIIAPIWVTATFLGAVVGTRIPESFALEFAMPLAFLAMIGPMLRTLPHAVAALVAIVVALLAVGIPYNLGLLVAGSCGMMAGAHAELVLRRREGAA